MGPDQNTDKNTDQENNTDNNIDQEKNTDKNTDQEKNTDNNTDHEKNTDQNTENNRDQEKNTDNNNTDQDHNTDQNTDNNRDQEKNTDKTVCVTGAGGFIASWLVKMLLAKGYTVRGAVHTDPADDGLKYKHLTELEGAKERLELMKADILDHQDLVTVIQGCHGVFHTACLLSNDPERVMEPAVNGTRNVMEVCAEMGVKRVVVTSSIGAVYMDPRRDPLAIVDDDCWSDLDHCIETKNWYCYAKILAEKLAWEIAEKRNLEVAVICPCVVLGPLLQPKMNASTAHIMKYLTGSAKTYKNLTQAYVDVRDVAEAHILVYETPSARGQRYLCAESNLHRGDLVNMLAELCPQYPLPTKCSDEENPRKEPYKFSNQKLRDLGLSFTPIKECLADTVANLQQKSFLP